MVVIFAIIIIIVMVKRRYNLSELTRHREGANELDDYTEVIAASPSFYTQLFLDQSARVSNGDNEYEPVGTVLSAPAQYKTLSTPDTVDPEHVYTKINNQ